MKPDRFLEIIHTVEKLKDEMRHCYTSGGRRESVAEHCFRIALMAMFVSDEFPNVDREKVIMMCLVHDLGEIFTGDIPVFAKTEEDEETEAKRLDEWVETLDGPIQSELRELLKEIKELQTPEAKLFKCLDSVEAVIQHNESDIQTWGDHEYSLNLNYASEIVKYSEYMTEFRQLVRQETLDKIAAANAEDKI